MTGPALTRQERDRGLAYTLFSLFFLPALLKSLLPALDGPRLNFLYYLLNLLCMSLLLRNFLLHSLRYAGDGAGSLLLYTGAGLALYFCCSGLLSLLLSRFFPAFTNINDGSIAAQLSKNRILMTLGTVLLVPLAEELMHRAVIFGALYPQSPAAAYLLSTALFAAVHVLGYVGKAPGGVLALSFLQYLPAGLILAWCYEKSGCILVPACIHTVVNAVGILTVR